MIPEVPATPEEGRDTLFDLFTSTVNEYPMLIAAIVVVLIVIALVKGIGAAASGLAGRFQITLGIVGVLIIAFAFFTFTR